jgi:hypothetical protein
MADSTLNWRGVERTLLTHLGLSQRGGALIQESRWFLWETHTLVSHSEEKNANRRVRQHRQDYFIVRRHHRRHLIWTAVQPQLQFRRWTQKVK